ncbi:anaerobic ribonucleoside-triphosphate reductase-activating protein [Salinibius halmophilus]|uniref:anaerobic ribonucleoside-triphosphate reductase-activating protein n=1 Tax=Salinibius halmophilus TaxID=1853216 RepID=UPI000E668C15|nr:anaerobic ribonucleoside-triphosphate reductase-activating protein [Salinibius halmophilus]
MHFSAYYPTDVVNGPGVRATLFVSGCTHACEGCYNRATWGFRFGQLFDQAMIERIVADLNDPRVHRQGLSLSGGDPLHPKNLPRVDELIDAVRQRCPGKDIWCWSGYRIETLTSAQQQVVAKLDVLVDGRFEQSQRSPELPWQGSANQRVIYVSAWYAAALEGVG